MQDHRFVIFLRKGERWNPQRPHFSQPGLLRHVEYYLAQLKAGIIAFGGPFLDGDICGVMVAEPGIAESEVRGVAERDPAVLSGLLTFEVCSWLLGLRRRSGGIEPVR